MSERIHDETIAAIEDLFRGKLSAERTKEVSSHVESCAECERVYQRYADAERAMFTKDAPLTPFASDRIQARLFGAPKPKASVLPRFAPVLAAVAAAVLAAIIYLPTDQLTARGGDTKTLAPESTLRALALQNNGGVVGVVDLGAGDKPLAKGDKVKLLADTSKDQHFASAVIVGANGKVIAEVAPIEIGPNADDAPIASSMLVDDTWPEGQVKIVLELAPTAKKADPDAIAHDDGAESVRVLEIKVEGPRFP